MNNYVRNINSALRRNRRILESLIGLADSKGKCARQTLSDQGFDFRFHTHQYQDKKSQTFNFCYDYGYRPLEGERVLIVKATSTQQVSRVAR